MPAPLKKPKKRTGTLHSFEDMSVRSSLVAEVHRASADLRTLLGTQWDSNMSQQPLRHQHFHSGLMINPPQHQIPQLPDTSCLYPSPQNLQPLPLPAPILPHLNPLLSTLAINSYASQTPLYNDCAFVQPNGCAAAENRHRRRFYPHQAPVHNASFTGHFSWPPAESAGEQQTETFQSEGQRLRPKRKSKESKVSLENKHAKYPEDNTTTTTLKLEPEETTETSHTLICGWDSDSEPFDLLPLIDAREELFDITRMEELEEQEVDDTAVGLENGCELEDKREQETSKSGPYTKPETEMHQDNIMTEIAIQKICQSVLERMELLLTPEKTVQDTQEVNERLCEGSELSLNVKSSGDQNEVDNDLPSNKHSKNIVSRINSPVCAAEPETPTTWTEEKVLEELALGDSGKTEHLLKNQVKQDTDDSICSNKSEEADDNCKTNPTKTKDDEARESETGPNEKAINELKEDHLQSSDLDHNDLNSPNTYDQDQQTSAEVTVNQSETELEISESLTKKRKLESKSAKDLTEEDKDSKDEEETLETSSLNTRTRSKADMTPSSSTLTAGETVRGKRKANKNPEEKNETEVTRTRGKQPGFLNRKQWKESARNSQHQGHEPKEKVSKTLRRRKKTDK
ncbi:uncharacterized protein LOC103384633 isoform X4 [Cynoglossus semilaevis]|uniref:uncharacterized protein LOC103384633 isoform X4 n=1 Tax=Cynoglossus semilaevis TaxID=244447 RepID=UPI0007DCAFF0|nr:uncharacterized protein LOC103384633 isoform X4 [Cynoglossus semilaevis]